MQIDLVGRGFVFVRPRLQNLGHQRVEFPGDGDATGAFHAFADRLVGLNEVAPLAVAVWTDQTGLAALGAVHLRGHPLPELALGAFRLAELVSDARSSVNE